MNTGDINKASASKVVYGIVGSGWRTEFFLRVAKELPDKFEVCGLVTRSEETGNKLENTFGIRTFRTIEDMLKFTNPGFVVVSVPGNVTPAIIKELAEKGVPVLSETPPAPDLEGLIELNKLTGKGARIQVAEQYHLQPMHSARIAIANSGKLGEINHVQVSFSHGYHGMSIMRRLLGIGFQNAKINALRLKSEFIAGPGRNGLGDREVIIEGQQEIAILDFGDKSAVYDFAPDQHRSFVRGNRILVRGNRGEINNKEVRYLKDFRTPIEYELIEKNTGLHGNIEGYFVKGVLAGEEWVYINPYIPGKLSEDEIAVASCLEKMDAYVKGCSEFYSLAEASQDHYLGLMIRKALDTGAAVITETQPWAYL
ncbi:MAG: Gfo/Idh/MocA family oxidoreductase [Bacillota bacterium]|nr:Gfo/Idh/MocA family oxidoreductase [Bacillota bacterium]